MDLLLWVVPPNGQFDERAPFDIRSDANAQSLHKMVATSMGLEIVRLSHGGDFFPRGDIPIADLALSQDLTIKASAWLDPPDWMRLKLMFEKSLVNRTTIPWWKRANHCANKPSKEEECSRAAMCEDGSAWRGVIEGWESPSILRCNDTTNEITTIYISGNSEFQLRGNLSLRWTPDTVRSIDISGQHIPFVEIRGAKSLKSLSLERNGISAVDLGQYSGTSLQWLDLSHNALTSFELQTLHGTKVEELKLHENKIATLDWKALRGTSLRVLQWTPYGMDEFDFGLLSGVPLNELDLSCGELRKIKLNLKDSNLTWLDLSMNEISNLSLTDLAGAKLKFLDLTANGISSFSPNDLLGLELEYLLLGGNALSGTLRFSEFAGSELKGLYLEANTDLEVLDFGGIQDSLYLELFDMDYPDFLNTALPMLRVVYNIDHLKTDNVSTHNNMIYNTLKKYYSHIDGVNISIPNPMDNVNISSPDGQDAVSPGVCPAVYPHYPGKGLVEEYPLLLGTFFAVCIIGVFVVIFRVAVTCWEIKGDEWRAEEEEERRKNRMSRRSRRKRGRGGPQRV